MKSGFKVVFRTCLFRARHTHVKDPICCTFNFANFLCELPKTAYSHSQFLVQYIEYISMAFSCGHLWARAHVESRRRGKRGRGGEGLATFERGGGKEGKG